MGLYKNTNGVLTPVAGRGKAEYGASTIRTGTFTNPELNAETAVSKTITFSTPMPDANYELSFSKDKDALCYLEVISKTASGFTVSLVRPYSSSLGANYCTYTYTAFKLYTDIEYNNILAAMPNDASSSNKLLAANSIVDSITNNNMKAVTSNAVADYLRDEFVTVIASFRNESLPSGIGEIYKTIEVPSGYTQFAISHYDFGRLQGLNITGLSLATIGKVRLATYCDRVITNELNGSVNVLCRKNL